MVVTRNQQIDASQPLSQAILPSPVSGELRIPLEQLSQRLVEVESSNSRFNSQFDDLRAAIDNVSIKMNAKSDETDMKIGMTLDKLIKMETNDKEKVAEGEPSRMNVNSPIIRPLRTDYGYGMENVGNHGSGMFP